MSKPLIRETIVPADYYGQRLDVVLAQVFPEFSRAKLSQWLKTGAITINGQMGKPKDKVLGGEFIVMTVNQQEMAQEATCQPESIQLNIVFEDDDFLVINKPAGLVVHPGAGNPSHTLVNALLYHCSNLSHLPRAGIVHRLDKETTGLLVVAKTSAAHTHLIRQMQAREIQRHYRALVHGHIIAGGLIETCFGRHPRNRLKMAVCHQGKPAITHYAVAKQFNHHFTLVHIKLLTGRTHQIRVHMAHIHHPVVGDPLYGGRARHYPHLTESLQSALQGFKRQALHACRLSFIHPTLNQLMHFEAPLPEDFQHLLSALETYFD